MAPPHSKKKTGTITIRDLKEKQHRDSQGSYHEEMDDQEGQGDQSPLNKDAIAKMAEFVNENPSFFEQLERLFMGKGKEKAELSKRRPEHSPPETSERRSVSK